MELQQRLSPYQILYHYVYYLPTRGKYTVKDLCKLTHLKFHFAVTPTENASHMKPVQNCTCTSFEVLVCFFTRRSWWKGGVLSAAALRIFCLLTG